MTSRIVAVYGICPSKSGKPLLNPPGEVLAIKLGVGISRSNLMSRDTSWGPGYPLLKFESGPVGPARGIRSGTRRGGRSCHRSRSSFAAIMRPAPGRLALGGGSGNRVPSVRRVKSSPSQPSRPRRSWMRAPRNCCPRSLRDSRRGSSRCVPKTSGSSRGSSWSDARVPRRAGRASRRHPPSSRPPSPNRQRRRRPPRPLRRRSSPIEPPAAPKPGVPLIRFDAPKVVERTPLPGPATSSCPGRSFRRLVALRAPGASLAFVAGLLAGHYIWRVHR